MKKQPQRARIRERLQPGDLVCADTNRRWVGHVVSVNLGPYRDLVQVELDKLPEYPPQMPLVSFSLERNWIRIG